MIRDKSIMRAMHVNTKENLSDIFTKILPVATFRELRQNIMTLMT